MLLFSISIALRMLKVNSQSAKSNNRYCYQKKFKVSFPRYSMQIAVAANTAAVMNEKAVCI